MYILFLYMYHMYIIFYLEYVCIYISSLFFLWAEETTSFYIKRENPKTVKDSLKVTYLGFEPNKTPGLWSLRVDLTKVKRQIYKISMFIANSQEPWILTEVRNPHSKPFLLLYTFIPVFRMLMSAPQFTRLCAPTVLRNGNCSITVCEWMNNGWMGHG